MILGEGSYFPYYELTAADLREVKQRYEETYPSGQVMNDLTVYDRKSSRLAGVAGELAFARYVGTGGQYVGNTSRSVDFITRGGTGDIKTKVRQMPPRPEYEGSFFSYNANAHFNVDYYVFMSTTEDISMIWFCGWIRKRDLLAHPKTRIYPAGETFPESGLTFKQDTISLQYQYMNKIPLK